MSPAERRTLLLVDANGLVYRAFFALPYFTTRDGRPTNAVYGFTTMLLKVLEEQAPGYVAVAFDKPGPTFRHEAFAEYKALRRPMPDDLRPQIAATKRVVEVLELPVFEATGFEADDVIGTLTRRAEADGFEVLIVTGDLDVLQLVSPHTKVMMTSRGISDTVIYDEAGVEAKLGVTPSQVPDFKSLKGDSTDNIPGVPGIGDKTAARVLAGGVTVERLLAGLNGMTDARLRAKLEEHREQILSSKHIATIATDVDLSVDWSALRRHTPDMERVRALFTDLEFRTLLDRLGVATAAPADQPRGGYRAIAASELGTVLEKATQLAVAPVAGEGHPFVAGLRGIALATRPGAAVYLDLGDGVPEPLADALEDEELPKFSQDVKRDILLLEGAGLKPHGFAFDVGLASFDLDAAKRTHTLATAAFDFLHWQLHDGAAGAGRPPAVEGGLALQAGNEPEFAGEEADVIVRLHDVMERGLRARDVDQLYRDLDLPLAFVLAGMERAGVAIDAGALGALSVSFRERLEVLTRDIHRLAGTEFNIGSPKQLAHVLFEKLQLPAQKKTKTGYSTDAEVLEQLAPLSEVVAKILEHRRLSKLLGTYVDALPAALNPKTGRLHPTYNQAGSSTGRIVTTEPNLQNIPIFEEDGREVRRAFVAGRPGNVLLSADYSQIELRVLAHITEDPGLLAAFREGRDIHTATSAEVFGVAPEAVTAEMRRQAKMFNYGIAYGITDYGLATRLKTSREEARAFMDTYFARYARVADYMRDAVERCRRDGDVRTLLGRRLPVPDILSRHRPTRERAERVAINAAIQGTAADIIKLAMLKIARELRPRFPGVEMVLQIHDELLFEVPRDLVAEAAPEIRRLMADAYPLRVPLPADAGVGPNWLDLTDVA
ncbi:MAG TPA: DNA polymerase I [bacterium]|nr:DNA polymerase I [bacterium]